jgi:hypothetical protein
VTAVPVMVPLVGLGVGAAELDLIGQGDVEKARAGDGHWVSTGGRARGRAYRGDDRREVIHELVAGLIDRGRVR